MQLCWGQHAQPGASVLLWHAAARCHPQLLLPPSRPCVARIPAQVRQYYRYLHDQKKYSDLTLVAGLLAVPVAIGARALKLVVGRGQIC